MANVNLTIDGRALSVPAGTSILAAAKENGIRIPTLCFMEKLDPRASCRMCVVEVEGARTFQHACAAKVKEGMVVRTNTEALRASRKLTLQLILSDHNVDCHHCLRMGNSRCADLDPVFCEMCFFCDCEKDGFCELQALAREYEVDVLPFTQRHNEYPIDATTAIVRNPNKCVKCKRCIDVCGKVQGVHNLSAFGRGSAVTIGPAFGKSMADSDCIGCGRCVELCPTGAIFAREHKDELIYYAHKEGLETVALVDMALTPELARVLKLDAGSITRDMLAGSLKKIGIDRVYDAADFREAAKAKAEAMLESRAGEGTLILTDNYAVKKLLTSRFPELKDSFAFFPSAVEEFADYAKLKHAGAKLFAFGAVGCDSVEAEETRCVGFAVNSREFSRIMRRTGSEPNPRRTAALEKVELPVPTGKYGRLLDNIDWSLEPAPESFTLRVDGKELRCALCRNIGSAQELIREQLSEFDIIRVVG